ncbi:hypothetical protein [Peterkaempfera bronchialis]|uniref:TIR domain-containing protein n=1 Tax=Peterkaempfera bronchialis TaxID=2126346 RepID=A0A345T350_9ACTN|nr:hypothetical protein [Peterkaempfera bronchialis]AXI80405.1 hypothetical protein C7M71_026405 [Peterkaempfera bronchialis]
MATYAVSYVEGDSEAWVAQFLADLQRELDRLAPGIFTRLGDAPNGRDGRTAGDADEDGLHGARTADVLLALCSPGYFGDPRVGREWAVAVQRRTLGRARTGVAPQTVLPVRWEPLPQRLPSAAAEADPLSARDLPAAYRQDGLAQLTMQAPRLRTAYGEVVAAVAGQLLTAATGPVAPPLPPDHTAAGLPDVFAADDAAFTRRFRAHLRDALTLSDGGPPVDVPRRAAPVGAGSGAALLREQLPDLGRRIVLLGPRGSGRRRELGWLARAVLEEEPGCGPWGCEVVLPPVVRPGGMPAVVDLVQAVAPRLRALEPAGWAARQLRSGRALMALGGLEAIPARDRGAVWEWLLRLLEEYPRTPCVVASDGVRLPWHRLDGSYALVRLEPWTAEESRAFLGLAARSAPGDRDGHDRAARGLAALLEHDPVLRDLMAWPASATGIWSAARTADPGPPDRQRLLDAAVSAAWLPDGGPAETAESAGPRPSGQAAESALRAAVGRLAVVAARADRTSLPWEAVAGAADRRPTGEQSWDLLEELAEHPGVMYQPEPSRLAFAHAALRDCLAAAELARRGAAEAVDAAVAQQTGGGSPELALLVVGMLPPGDRDAFLTGLLDHHGAGTGGRALLLTTAAAAAMAGCGEAVADRLRAALRGLGPLESADLPLVARGGSGMRDLLPPGGAAALPPAAGTGTGGGAAPPVRAAAGAVRPVRRLPARPVPALRHPGPREVRSRGDLEGLTGLGHSGEVHWLGPIGDPGPLLGSVRGLRSLLIDGDPGLTALPDLSGCRTLRTLTVRGCPELRDLTALAASEVVFAELEPGTPHLDLDPLRRAPWLRRVDLVRDRGAPVSVWYLGRVEVRVHARGGVVDRPVPV